MLYLHAKGIKKQVILLKKKNKKGIYKFVDVNIKSYIEKKGE